MNDAGSDPEAISIREAGAGDVVRLAEIEQHCFVADRISRRQFRYLTTKANATVLVAELGRQVIGSLVVL